MKIAVSGTLKRVVGTGKEDETPRVQIVLETDATKALGSLLLFSGQPVNFTIETFQRTLDEAMSERDSVEAQR